LRVDFHLEKKKKEKMKDRPLSRKQGKEEIDQPLPFTEGERSEDGHHRERGKGKERHQHRNFLRKEEKRIKLLLIMSNRRLPSAEKEGREFR